MVRLELHDKTTGRLSMRLDKYLKVSRLIKRRTVANEACDQGRVAVNGKTAKAGSEVSPGDEISLRMGSKLYTLRVNSTQEHVSKDDAAMMYDILREESL